jgi:hypothetical protein
MRKSGRCQLAQITPMMGLTTSGGAVRHHAEHRVATPARLPPCADDAGHQQAQQETWCRPAGTQLRRGGR